MNVHRRWGPPQLEVLVVGDLQADAGLSSLEAFIQIIIRAAAPTLLSASC